MLMDLRAGFFQILHRKCDEVHVLCQVRDIRTMHVKPISLIIR
jgi:hypothetical protein